MKNQSLSYKNKIPKALAKLAVCSALSLLAIGTSHATILTFDMRAVSSGSLASDQGGGASSGVTINDPHSVRVGASARIVLQLWAVYSDPNTGGTDSFNFTSGAISSFGSSGSFLSAGAGSFRTGTLANNVTGFDQTGATSGGNTVDVSASYPYTNGTSTGTTVTAPTTNGTADGILDLGDTVANNAVVPTATTSWWSASSGATALTLGANVTEVLIGEFALTLGPGISTGQTSVGYFLKAKSGGTVASKFYNVVNGASLSYVGANSANTISDAFAFQSVTLAVVPEPSTYVSLLGGLGMLAFWQRSRRHKA